jgi:hypothetical protein
VAVDFFMGAFLAGDFLAGAAFFAADFFAGAAFFAADFFAGAAFFAADFFAGAAFFAADFLAGAAFFAGAVFFVADFLAGAAFFAGAAFLAEAFLAGVAFFDAADFFVAVCFPVARLTAFLTAETADFLLAAMRSPFCEVRECVNAVRERIEPEQPRFNQPRQTRAADNPVSALQSIP